MNEKNSNKLCIAICDDEKIFHDELYEVISKYQESRNINIQTVHFFSAKELIEYSGDISILLLDISMPDMDGLEAGLILREHNKDYRIIMLTSMKDKAAESMKIGAFRFVQKPLYGGVELFEALDDSLATFLGYSQMIVKYKNVDVSIYQHQINYIKSMGNYVKIFSDNKIFEKNVTLKNIISELDVKMFVRTDKSYIVNLARIEDIGKNKCILAGDIEIPLSRRLYKEVSEAYSIFDAKGYNGIRNGYFY